MRQVDSLNMKVLVLDGPRNGDYITMASTTEFGTQVNLSGTQYELVEWDPPAWREAVLMLVGYEPPEELDTA